MKTLRMLVFIFISILPLHAAAPELKHVMPNSWKKLTRLEKNEEGSFIRENLTLVEWLYKAPAIGQAYGTIASERPHIQPKYIPYDPRPIVYVKPDLTLFWAYEYPYCYVYTEKIYDTIFYRVIVSAQKVEDLNSADASFVQCLVIKKGKAYYPVTTLGYNIPYYTSDSYGERIHNDWGCIDIIDRGNFQYGILFTEVSGVSPYCDTYEDFLARKKNEFAIRNSARYVLGSHFLKKNIYDDFDLYPSAVHAGLDLDGIGIYASPCLYDEKKPLHYSIQNAFDGDPATSYVENTGHNLMLLFFQDIEAYDKVALINGYAANKTLYEANNRVHQIASVGDIDFDEINYTCTFDKINYNYKPSAKSVSLKDNTLDMQICSLEGSYSVLVQSIYAGKKYTDTCIAEFNIKTKQYGWLFGPVSE